MVVQSRRQLVLALLKKGLVEKACEAAMAQGNSFLATLIATEPHLLLDFDEEMFDQETSAIFALISGSLPRLSELTPEKLRCISAHEWFQYFALFIWYHGPARSSLLIPVNEAVREYEALMRTISGTDEASPFPSLETSTIANLCMELLKLFSCPSGYPLPRLLRPRTWTEDGLDYKLVWLLLRDFEEMRFHTEDETYFELCLNFANQLEVIGMWTWAIFVVKNIVPSPYEDDKDEWTKLYKKRDAFYQRLLERNINQDRMDDYFLVHRLGIKEKLLLFRQKLEDTKNLVFGQIGKWQQSLEMLINYLIRGNGLALVAEENNASGYSRNVFDYLRSLRRKCKAMESWETGSGCRDKEKKEEDELLQIVASFLDSVTKFQPSGMNNCALLLEMVVSVQKVVQCLFTS
ncbi:Nuclear pore complex protein Nup98-Nup96, partial [Orchesella cincta]